MAEAHEVHQDEPARLAGARAEFVASLGRRLEALRGALELLEQEPHSTTRASNLMRRAHAMGAAARVLGFAGVAEALAGAERLLERAGTRGGLRKSELVELRSVIEGLPALVWGASAPRQATRPDAQEAPLSVVVFGSSKLQESLRVDDIGLIECEGTEDVAEAVELAKRLAPDVGLIDADLEGASRLVEQLLADPLIEPTPLVVVGSFDSLEAPNELIAKGVSTVLPKPASPDALRRAVVDASRHRAEPIAVPEPMGELTVPELVERIEGELRRGLVESLEQGGSSVSVPIGDGNEILAAVWSSVARIREHITLRSGGVVRFAPGGPEGAVPLAAWASTNERPGVARRGERDASDVSLEGRKIVVADDDPAVVWFLNGVFRAAGAEVLEAHDGRHALELARDFWPDLVVSDVMMPELDGFELCRALKRDVAVRDVPVVLLSWKEDLLQRLREIGAEADAYLRKEASGSIVIERVKEVLRPRARVEARMVSDVEVRGRLDGLTPRLVLQLASQRQGDAKVTIRDAAHLYEVQIRRGELRCITRTAVDGSFDRGEPALRALLGVSAGRFVVAADASSVRNDFTGSLGVVLAEPIRHARAALDALSSKRLGGVSRVEIDLDAMAGYLDKTPAPAKELIERVAEGASPRKLIEGGEVSLRLLEDVLVDLARRGAIRRVLDASGVDQIAEALKSPEKKRGRLAPTPPPAGVGGAEPEKAAAKARQASPEKPSDEVEAAFSFALSDAPPHVAEAIDDSWSDVAEGIDTSPSPDLPMNRRPTPVPMSRPSLDPAWGEERHTAPGLGTAKELGTDDASLKRGGKPVDLAEAVLGAMADDADDQAKPDEIPTKTPPPAGSAAPVVREVRRPSPPRPDKPADPAGPTREAASDAPTEASPAPAGAAAEPSGASPSDDEADAIESALTHTTPSPGVSHAVAKRVADDLASKPGEVDASAFKQTLESVVKPWEAMLDRESFPVAEEEAAVLPPAKKITFPGRASKQSKGGEKAKGGGVTDTLESAPEHERPKRGDAMDTLDSATDHDEPRRGGVTDTLESAPDHPRTRRTGAAYDDESPFHEPDESPLGPMVDDRPRSKSGLASRARAAAAPLVGALAAALLSFGAVRWLYPSADPPAPASEPAPTAAGPVKPPPLTGTAKAKAKPKAAKPSEARVVPQDLDIPKGLDVAADKGVLEVLTGGKQSIYVDGEFVGRGPKRWVPIAPGQYQVKTRLEGKEKVHSVTVKQGRRTSLPLEAAWKE